MKIEGYANMIIWKDANTQAEGLVKSNQIHGPLFHLKMNNTYWIESTRNFKIPIGLLTWGYHVPIRLQRLTVDFHGALKFSLLPQNVTNTMYGIWKLILFPACDSSNRLHIYERYIRIILRLIKFQTYFCGRKFHLGEELFNKIVTLDRLLKALIQWYITPMVWSIFSKVNVIWCIHCREGYYIICNGYKPSRVSVKYNSFWMTWPDLLKELIYISHSWYISWSSWSLRLLYPFCQLRGRE